MKQIDWKKPLRFRENHAVTPRYVCHDGKRAIIAFENNGRMTYASYNSTGCPSEFVAAGVKIENAPPPKIVKIRKLILWKDGSVGVREGDWVPNGSWHLNVIAVKEVTITEGEGLPPKEQSYNG